MRKKNEILIKLFLSTLKLSAFTFGGGYVIITLMKNEFVDKLNWIEEEDILDLVAIAQSSPGAIAVNGAIVVGYKLAGLIGVIVSILATLIPPFIIITIISLFYEAFKSNLFVNLMLQGMQAGIAATICSVAYEMGAGIVDEKDNELMIIMILAFIATAILKINVFYLIIICILLGCVKAYIVHKEEKQ